MTRFRTRAGLTAVALGVLATTLAAPALARAEPENRPASASGIDWHACADADFKGMQCGSLRVPIDWSRPGSGSLSLALVSRRPMTRHTARARCCSTTVRAVPRSSSCGWPCAATSRSSPGT